MASFNRISQMYLKIDENYNRKYFNTRRWTWDTLQKYAQAEYRAPVGRKPYSGRILSSVEIAYIPVGLCYFCQLASEIIIVYSKLAQ